MMILHIQPHQTTINKIEILIRLKFKITENQGLSYRDYGRTNENGISVEKLAYSKEFLHSFWDKLIKIEDGIKSDSIYK